MRTARDGFAAATPFDDVLPEPEGTRLEVLVDPGVARRRVRLLRGARRERPRAERRERSAQSVASRTPTTSERPWADMPRVVSLRHGHAVLSLDGGHRPPRRTGPAAPPALEPTSCRRSAPGSLGAALVGYLAFANGGYDTIVRSQVGIAVWWIVLVGAVLGVLPGRLSAAGWVAVGLLVALTAFAGLSDDVVGERRAHRRRRREVRHLRRRARPGARARCAAAMPATSPAASPPRSRWSACSRCSRACTRRGSRATTRSCSSATPRGSRTRSTTGTRSPRSSGSASCCSSRSPGAPGASPSRRSPPATVPALALTVYFANSRGGVIARRHRAARCSSR